MSSNSFIQLVDIHVKFWVTKVIRGGGAMEGWHKGWGTCERKYDILFLDNASAILLSFPAM